MPSVRERRSAGKRRTRTPVAAGWHTPSLLLELFPESAAIETGELALGGLGVSELVERFGTPLVVYCRRTIVEAARAYSRAAPESLVAYGLKAFPNVAIVRLLAAQGLGADVSTVGELRFALAGGVPAEKILVHGNNKGDEELTAAANAEVALVVLDALEEIERAAKAGIRRVLVRVTPGIDVDTHPAIRTAHHGSKFGLPPEQALEALRRAGEASLDRAGLHVHLGSQLVDLEAALASVDWVAAFAADCRTQLDWTPEIVDFGGGLGIRYLEEETPPVIEVWVAELLARAHDAWARHGLPEPRFIFEPGRSLVGRAGVTVYRVGVVKELSEATAYVAIDGGMSDNPRPQLYGAKYRALLANRADEEPARTYSVCGKHCESGDVLIDRAALPRPRRGDLLAVPATGAYTLGMSSNYNVVPRPGAVLVAGGEAELIRRRETVEDLLEFEI